MQQKQYPKKWAVDIVKVFIATCARGSQTVENLIGISPEMAAYDLQFRNFVRWESYKWICKQVEREFERCRRINSQFRWNSQHVVDLMVSRWAWKPENSIKLPKKGR